MRNIAVIVYYIAITVGSFTDKIVSLFKTNTPENYSRQTVYGRGKKPSEVKIQKKKKKSEEDNIIKNKKTKQLKIE